MKKIELTAVDLGSRFIGLKEIPGHTANPAILAMLQLEDRTIQDDEVAWCSAFVNYIAWLLGLPRSKSLAARSWLLVGRSVDIASAEVGFTVVILKRGDPNQPGPEVIQALGHIGFFMGTVDGMVKVLGGNQGDAVNICSFPVEQVLGLRVIYGD